MSNMVTERVDNPFSAFTRVADEIDHDLWAQTEQARAKVPGRFARAPINCHHLNGAPCGASRIRSRIPAAHTHHVMAVSNEPRYHVAAHVPGTTYHHDAHSFTPARTSEAVPGWALIGRELSGGMMEQMSSPRGDV